MKLTIGKKKIGLNTDTMLKAGSFEAYYEKLSGLYIKLGVNEEFLKQKLKEAYILTIKPAPKPKVQKQSTAKPAVQASGKMNVESESDK